MRKISTILLSSVIIATSVGSTFARPFPDVQDNYVYKDAIEYMKTNDIVSGFSDGEFKPDRTITRAEFTKILINQQFPNIMMGSNYSELVNIDCIGGLGTVTKPHYYGEFSDVETYSPAEKGYVHGVYIDIPAKGNKFAPYICVAKKKGIIDGYFDGTFRPDQAITIAEASKIISNTYGLTNNPVTSGQGKFKVFLDALIAKNALPYPISGYYLTRAEMAEIIFRIETNATNKTSPSYSSFNSAMAEDYCIMNGGEPSYVGCGNLTLEKCTSLGGEYRDFSCWNSPSYPPGMEPEIPECMKNTLYMCNFLF
jgi:hypothetical protein